MVSKDDNSAILVHIYFSVWHISGTTQELWSRNVQTENVSRNAVCDALMGKAPNPVPYWYLMKN